eukprot:6645768-Prymnesium_polylepis.1
MPTPRRAACATPPEKLLLASLADRLHRVPSPLLVGLLTTNIREYHLPEVVHVLTLFHPHKRARGVRRALV